ncbi:MAG: thiamine-phosphate kinase [Gammaproteobacteria bacterium]|nr:thiamine-phosphate kinase [Rhodocyclaceae bacterium]MBU3909186.1 thiamine-phosphate kinase [Gammaproteobacteria bacterium]MBU3990002.1 thiamine-phosphate kinase [Gammaproteobacteria bacterium]MBU4005654.1 thiamine-phosphate kinase [Gammaproteobacteria bacterium]MBU4020793.1 thiamine-phosphate kinase [Gammaproteobacteria bacterium]
MPSEFALIDRYFRRGSRHTVLGIGDDGAIVRPSAGCELVISTDMLVAGTHFLAATEPTDLGWKTLAVNVSDLAAMGAQPRWALLAAALPEANEAWIEKFADGFFACADAFDIDVIGGDTTKGPRNFCVTIFGEVPAGQALLRSGAQAGDEIWVSGMPGRAALALAHLQGRTALSEPALTDCLAALQRPQPRVALGLALRGLATAAIDVSDGLLADLGHILTASGKTAVLQTAVPHSGHFILPTPTFERECYLAGGDDYELVFTAPPALRAQVEALGASLVLPLHCLGNIAAGIPGQLTVLDPTGQPIDIARRGYDHFS